MYHNLYLTMSLETIEKQQCIDEIANFKTILSKKDFDDFNKWMKNKS